MPVTKEFALEYVKLLNETQSATKTKINIQMRKIVLQGTRIILDLMLTDNDLDKLFARTAQRGVGQLVYSFVRDNQDLFCK